MASRSKPMLWSASYATGTGLPQGLTLSAQVNRPAVGVVSTRTRSCTYCICEDNDNFKDPCVAATQHPAEKAVVEAGAKAAFWVGGVLPRSIAARRPIKVSIAEWNFVIDGPLVEIMCMTGRAEVDDAGGKLGATTIRRVGACGTAVLFHSHNKQSVFCTAFIYLRSRQPNGVQGRGVGSV